MVPKCLYCLDIFHSREALNDLYVTSECQSYSLEFGKNVSSCQATNIINILFGQEKTKSNGNAFVHRSQLMRKILKS